MNHVRIGKEVRISDALTFLAGEREHLEEAWRAILLVYTTTVQSRLVILSLAVKTCTSQVFLTSRRKCSAVYV